MIDELLEQPGYAAWWAVRLSDWTGNNEVQMNNVFPVRAPASRYWYAWIEKRLEDNVPYDEIVEGLVDAESRLLAKLSAIMQTMSAACEKVMDEAFASVPESLNSGAATTSASRDRAVGFAYSFWAFASSGPVPQASFDQWSKQDFDKFAVLFSSIQVKTH